CKNDKKGTTPSQDTKEAEEVLVDKNILSFIINAIASQNDEFIVYYLDVDDKEISNNRSISKSVKGSEIQQKITFDFPEGVIPTRIIIKTGKNKENKIDIIDAIFVLNDKDFKISGDRFFDYFIPNEFIEYDKATSSYSFKFVNEKFNPSFLSRKVLIDKLEMIFY